MAHIRLPIIIETEDFSPSDSGITVKHIDYNDKRDKNWLAKHVLWCIHNQREVRTRHASVAIAASNIND